MKHILLILMMLGSMFIAGVALAADVVNINTATVEQLQTVKGIGEKTAKAIVDYRQAHGDFANVASLTAVKGIGGRKLEKLAGALTVNAAK